MYGTWNRGITGILRPTSVENERHVNVSCVLHVWNTELRHINGLCLLQDCNMIMSYIDFLFPTKMNHRTQIYNRFCVLHVCNMKVFSDYQNKILK